MTVTIWMVHEYSKSSSEMALCGALDEGMKLDEAFDPTKKHVPRWSVIFTKPKTCFLPRHICTCSTKTNLDRYYKCIIYILVYIDDNL